MREFQNQNRFFIGDKSRWWQIIGELIQIMVEIPMIGLKLMETGNATPSGAAPPPPFGLILKKRDQENFQKY